MSLIDCKCILLIFKSSGVNLPTYNISLRDSCKLLLRSGKVLQCVLEHSVDSWRVITYLTCGMITVHIPEVWCSVDVL